MKATKKYDYLYENLILRRTPNTAQEAYLKLMCLDDLADRRDPRPEWCRGHYSKRRARIVKMYWAYKNTGIN